MQKKFAHIKKKQYFCTRFQNKEIKTPKNETKNNPKKLQQ